MATSALRICPLCEATCGLTLTLDGERVTRVRGDDRDVFSRGYLCPKGVALADLHHDPDRLSAPLVRQADGSHAAVSWDEAFATVERLLGPLLDGDRDRIGVYAGNPNVHTLAGQLLLPAFTRMLGTRAVFTASTMDQMPKHVSAALMFGDKLSIPVPDVDRTDYLLMLGANPLASNGSLWTAPDLPGRLRALRERGGRLVVADPRRSETAAKADRHVQMRPGTDALWLAALVNVLCSAGRADLGRLGAATEGFAEVERAVAPFTPERVAPATGVAAATTAAVARDLADAERACVYGRIGTHAARFGTLASWLVDVLNAVTGNLDEPGGALFPLAPAGQRNARASGKPGRATQLGRWHSSVRGMPEVLGELPVACLADELAGGGIAALITIAGNPALSAPNAGALARALADAEVLISVDPYLNETTRHAHVVLPPPSPLHSGHYDLAFTQLAVRNVARWTPPTLPLPEGLASEWEIMLRLTAIAAGQGAEAHLGAVEDAIASALIEREVRTDGSPYAGHDPAAVLAALAPRRGAERLLDFLLRAGPYGAGPDGDDGLTLDALEAAPHGIDLGPLESRLPGLLRTASGRVELAPAPILDDVPRLRAALDEPWDDGLVLVGRRQLRSNNSWMHNLAPLVGGANRCTLHVHPHDAARLGLRDSGRATATSAAGKVEVDVEVTDAIRPGVVSLPHGWGHDGDGTRLTVAARSPGVNSNLLTPGAVDPLSGNAVLNGIAVEVAPAG